MSTGSDFEKIFQQLMKLDNLARYADARAMEALGSLIDLSSDLDRDDGLDKALAWCDELEQRPLKGPDIPTLDYFRANAWHARQRTKHQAPNIAWSWDQPEALEQIRFLRRATRHPEFENLDTVRRAQIFTNLANLLNSLGRFVEAVPTWRRALSVNPRFGMALGNRGLGLSEYGRGLYDGGHAEVFLLFAHKDLTAALSPDADYAGYPDDDAQAAFARRQKHIEHLIDCAAVQKSLQMDGYPLGDTSEEQEYRRWVLANGLFLNPLNDLGPHSISARDIFGLPSFTTKMDEPPTLIGLFNQMKQEYISARCMLYEGMEADTPHFADRGVTLPNTLDYPSYSIAVEKVKAAFRIAYSLFDKIAFFLNDYAKLGINPKQIYFKTIWYSNQDWKRGVRKEFLNSRNWPVRGLYWLSRDLFDAELQATAEPDAQELYIIRNCLEHSYLKVHEMLIPLTNREDMWLDRLAFSVQREDFFRRTLRVLRLARAALIYLSLGMHHEERQRPSSPNSLMMPMFLDTWEDEWKF
ncbi:tetratricopeptide (TPR) repeat protein [Bradyrhizobium sp. USDA 4448]